MMIDLRLLNLQNVSARGAGVRQDGNKNQEGSLVRDRSFCFCEGDRARLRKQDTANTWMTDVGCLCSLEPFELTWAQK